MENKDKIQKSLGTLIAINSEKREVSSMKNTNILIIEDDKFMNETLCEVLESENYNVDSAMSALEGISLINNNPHKYDVLVLDYNLQHIQGINGIDIFNIARDKNSGVKAIMVSAYGKESEIKNKALNSGISVFLDKPFLINDLLDEIENLSGEMQSKQSLI
jgi:DNA-binding response OmpR family regulator